MRMVPDGTTSIGFEDQAGSGFVGYVRGPLLSPVEKCFEAATTLIGVRLRPGVVFNLTGIAAHELLNQRVPLSAFATLRELVAMNECNQTHDERISALQRILSARLAETSIHPVIEQALAAIHAALGCISVEDLAIRCHTSARHLGRLMRDWIGYGPKRYAAIVRFQNSLAGMEHAPNRRPAAIATDTGYFDQSHMSADVARFAGATPGELIERSVSEFSKTRCDVPF
jgi:methylphosphotriester-DNA--protein-cysteine methyltransferase